MKDKLIFLILMGSILALPAEAQDVFTGDTRLACEAVLCLATAKRPSECDPAVSRYRSIKHKKFRDTINARRQFLALCPKGPSTPMLEALLDAQSTAEQFCDPSVLNWSGDPRVIRQENGLDFSLVNRGCGAGMWCVGERQEPRISNVLPAQCAALANHPYVYEVMPRYVGTPDLFGRWVRPEDYEVAKANYDRALPGMIAHREELEAAANATGGQ